MAAAITGQDVSRDEIGEVFADAAGVEHSFGDIAAAARSLGLATRLVHLETNVPPNSSLPMIAHVRKSLFADQPNHFLVVLGVSDDAVQVIDGSREPRWVPNPSFAALWEGWVMFVAGSESELVAAVDDPSPRRWGLITATLLGFASGVILLHRHAEQSVSKSDEREGD